MIVLVFVIDVVIGVVDVVVDMDFLLGNLDHRLMDEVVLMKDQNHIHIGMGDSYKVDSYSYSYVVLSVPNKNKDLVH